MMHLFTVIFTNIYKFLVIRRPQKIRIRVLYRYVNKISGYGKKQSEQWWDIKQVSRQAIILKIVYVIIHENLKGVKVWRGIQIWIFFFAYFQNKPLNAYVMRVIFQCLKHSTIVFRRRNLLCRNILWRSQEIECYLLYLWLVEVTIIFKTKPKTKFVRDFFAVHKLKVFFHSLNKIDKKEA